MVAPSVAWMNGGLVSFAEARVPVEDRGLQFGESLYEVVAIAGGNVQRIEAHATRMCIAAEELGLEEAVPDAPAWKHIAAELCARDPVHEGLLYAQVTGGAAPRAHVSRSRPCPSFWAYLRDYRFPRDQDVARGLRAVTVPDVRWSRCDLKTTMLLPAVMAKRAANAAGAEEALFVGPGGEVREGASSNVFLVEGSDLVSPVQTRHLLPGTTGAHLRKLSSDAGLRIDTVEVTLERLWAADELFVASTTLLVMPVTHVDGRAIGDATAGPVTRDLARRLRADLGLEGIAAAGRSIS